MIAAPRMDARDKPAFPRVSPDGDAVHYGMSLRDYFAAASLPLLTALIEARRDNLLGHNQEIAVARVAYMIADAMVAERDK